MLAAVSYVAAHPGCSKLECGTALLPHAVGKNNAFVYGPVNRAIQAGLIRAERGGSRYALHAV